MDDDFLVIGLYVVRFDDFYLLILFLYGCFQFFFFVFSEERGVFCKVSRKARPFSHKGQSKVFEDGGGTWKNFDVNLEGKK